MQCRCMIDATCCMCALHDVVNVAAFVECICYSGGHHALPWGPGGKVGGEGGGRGISCTSTVQLSRHQHAHHIIDCHECITSQSQERAARSFARWFSP